MFETAKLGLPLLQASQAQKHVTVNDGLVRLDAVCQLIIESQVTAIPPDTPDEGRCYAVPVGAVNAWAGQSGKIAYFTNGAWAFVAPAIGWLGWISDEARLMRFDGTAWRGVLESASPSGARMWHDVVEVEESVSAGLSHVTGLVIPQYAVVTGVTARILSELTGTLVSWQIGIAGAENRYASGLGLAAGTWALGVSGAPTAYYSNTPIVLTAVGGDFAGGAIRLALHMTRLSVPDM